MTFTVKKIEWLLLVYLFTNLATAGVFPNPEDIRTSARLQITDPMAGSLQKELESQGFDILHESLLGNSFEMVVSPGDFKEIRDRGLTYSILEVGRPLKNLLPAKTYNEQGIPEGYLKLEEIEEKMLEFASTYPTIAKYIDITQTYGGEPTVEGHHLYALKVSDNVNLDEDEVSILSLSGLHAREMVPPTITLYTIDKMLSSYNTDPSIKALIDENELWFVAIWNPDGYLHVWEDDNLWRKNRRVFSDGIGVDLNRNYPKGWNGNCAGTDNQDNLNYRGPSASSEAETRTLMAWTEVERFSKVMDFHSRGREVVWGYGCDEDYPWWDWHLDQAIEFSEEMGYGGKERGPSATGEMYQWQMARGALALLGETETEFQPDYEDALTEAADVYDGIIWMFERPVSVYGHVSDNVTGGALEALIELPDIDFTKDERFVSDAKFGRFDLVLPPGSHRVKFSADKYFPFETTVNVTNSSSEYLDVKLVKDISSVKEFAGSQLEFAGHTIHPSTRTLTLYNLKGKLIRVLHRDQTASFTMWDYKDANGQAVPGGVYHYRTDRGERNRLFIESH